MPSRRTVRKPTVWTPEEWRHIEEAAVACGVRPLRYVRQAALPADLPPCTRRRGARALRHEFATVLDTLHQFLRLAQSAGDPSITAALESTIRITNEAAEAAAARRGSAEPLIIAVREAGRVLDRLAHQARASEALPADEELGAALVAIQIAALGAARVTLGGVGRAVRSISTPSRRTIRKTAVWTPDEWCHIVVVAHKDRSHPHLHFIVNRVHPTRFVLWRKWWDYGRLERSLRAQEVELGLRVVPGRHAPVPSLDRAREGHTEGWKQGARWIKPLPGPKRGDHASCRT